MTSYYLQACNYNSDCVSYNNVCCTGYYNDVYNPTYGSSYTGF